MKNGESIRQPKRTNMRFAIALCAMLSVQYSTIYAQQQKNSLRIAYLHAGSTSSISTDAFREGLRNLGYIDGKNLTIEHQYSHGIDSRLPDLATELLRLKPDVIFTANASAALALKNATSTVPIVVVLTADPVAIGLVKSLARPGGNVTGLTLLSNSPEIIGKRLEILKEAVPGVKLVAILRNPASSAAIPVFKELKAVAQTLRVQLQPVEVRNPSDFDKAFSTITNKHADSLMVLSSSNTTNREVHIVKFATASRLPAMYFRPQAVDQGGLMYYGPNDPNLFFRAATYVDKIIKGAKPGDLPVEQPTKFELVINLKTAKQIGITIPPNVLARADRVIK